MSELSGSMATALIILEQCALTGIYILIGAFAYYKKWLGDQGIKDGINIILYIVTPAVIVESFKTQKFSADRIGLLVLVAGLALLAHLLAYPLSKVAFRKCIESRKSVFTFGTMCSNCGYFAIPLLYAIGANEAVFYGSIYIAVFNLVQWSIGLKVMEKNAIISHKLLLFNPGMLGLAAALVVFVGQFKLPSIIDASVHAISLLNSPLAMMLVGAQIIAYKPVISQFIRNLNLWRCIAYRLLIVPAVFGAIIIALMCFLPINRIMGLSLLIPAAAPVAGNTVLFAGKFKQDIRLSTELVAVSTVLSCFSITLLVFLFECSLKWFNLA